MTRPVLATLLCVTLLNATAQTPNINIVFNIQHATCGNSTGSILASVWGGVPPYSFLWSPTPPTGQGTSSLTDLPPGTYTLTVIDANANEAAAEATVVLTPDLFPAITGQTAWACDAGCSGYFNYYVPLPSGSAPYSVSFSPSGPGGGASPNGLYFNTLCIGETYDITVTDNNGCAGYVSMLEVEGPMAPSIVNQTVAPSCPGGATGGFVIEFSDADSIIINPGQVAGTLVGNMFTATNLAPGAYTIWVSAGNGSATPPGGTSGSWCSTSFIIEVPETTEPCGTVSGSLFADLNADCVQNTNDPGIPYRVVSIEPGGHFALTNANGEYATEVLFAAYTMNASLANYNVVCPVLPAPFTLDAGSPTASVDIALEPDFGPDASTFLAAGVHRPGFQVQYTVSAQNQGPYAFDGATLNLFFDPILVLNENGGGALIAPGHLQWDLGTLAPFSNTAFVATFSVPSNSSLIGTQVTCTAALDLAVPDSDPSNDDYVRTSTIVGAFDPNDKLATTSSRLSDAFYYLDADQWVDYTIRFQNTGTAEAINVHLTDTISPLLDLVSLQMLGTSHAFTAQLLTGRVLRFDFPGIMLPDSTSDQLGSQGFISFRLRPINGLGAGELLANNADIYFDFNEPIRTNTAERVTEFSTGMSEHIAAPLFLYPNPAYETIMLQVPSGAERLEVRAIDGRLLLVETPRTTLVRLGIEGLPQGMYTVQCHSESGMIGQARFVRR